MVSGDKEANGRERGRKSEVRGVWGYVQYVICTCVKT